MKNKLSEKYIVITRKRFNGDTVYILLSKYSQSYVGSFSLDNNTKLIYETDFHNMGIIELQQLLTFLEEFKYEK